MFRFLAASGPFGLIQLVVAFAIALMAIVRAVQLFGPRPRADEQVEAGLHAILFWGGITAALGILGQCNGIYNAIGAIVQATEISPRVVALGFGESFTSTILGLTIFMFSAILWFILFARFRQVARRADVGVAAQ